MIHRTQTLCRTIIWSDKTKRMRVFKLAPVSKRNRWIYEGCSVADKLTIDMLYQIERQDEEIKEWKECYEDLDAELRFDSVED